MNTWTSDSRFMDCSATGGCRNLYLLRQPPSVSQNMYYNGYETLNQLTLRSNETKTGPRSLKVGYIRVSSIDQNPARQREGLEVGKVFEESVSAKARERPVLEEALRFVREGDALVVYSMDRLGRSLVDLVNIVEGLTSRGVAVEFVKEKLRFTKGDDDPFAKLQFQIFAAVAEFERSMIKQRQREGLAAARAARGKLGGRPKVISNEIVAEATRLIEGGMTKTAVAKELGIGRATLYRALNSKVA